MFTDFTKRKRAEDALRASEAHIKALLDAVPDQILNLDRSGRLRGTAGAAIYRCGSTSRFLAR